MFTALAAELSGPAAAGLTACELEDLLDERGREVIRQLLQDHYDLRTAREEQQAREQRTPATGSGSVTTLSFTVAGKRAGSVKTAGDHVLVFTRRISSPGRLTMLSTSARMLGVPAGWDVRPCRGSGPVRKVGTE